MLDGFWPRLSASGSRTPVMVFMAIIMYDNRGDKQIIEKINR